MVNGLVCVCQAEDAADQPVNALNPASHRVRGFFISARRRSIPYDTKQGQKMKLSC